MYEHKTWLELKNICKLLNISHFGTKQEILERLIREEKRREEECEIKECSICLDQITKDNHILPCNHQLHTYCFNELKKTSNKCPLCRKEFEEEIPELVSDEDILFQNFLDMDIESSIEILLTYELIGMFLDSGEFTS